ncbi:Uncharacterised protein [Candidatus Gugararchaeum adminiculabundum]|nr:Uncharacterised protein [Candidatus Gugararchaeum adminiculabundum]
MTNPISIMRAELLLKDPRAVMQRDPLRKVPAGGHEGCLVPITLESKKVKLEVLPETLRSEILMMKVFRDYMKETGKMLDGERLSPEDFTVRVCERLRSAGVPVVDLIYAKDGVLFMDDFRIGADRCIDGANFDFSFQPKELQPPANAYFAKHSLEIFEALGKIHGSGFVVSNWHTLLSVFFIVIIGNESKLLVCDYSNLDQRQDPAEFNSKCQGAFTILLTCACSQWDHTREEFVSAYEKGKNSIQTPAR